MSSRAEMPGEAALMDRIYRRQRHVYDFTRKYYLLGRDELVDRLGPPGGGRVLAVGRRAAGGRRAPGGGRGGPGDRRGHGAQPDRRRRAMAAGAAVRHRYLSR